MYVLKVELELSYRHIYVHWLLTYIVHHIMHFNFLYVKLESTITIL